MEKMIAGNHMNKLSVEDPHNSENQHTRYRQDCHQLLTMLPKEVWDHIGSLLDIKEFLSLNNSSLFFRDIFLRKRALLLHKPIMEVLIPNLGASSEAPSTENLRQGQENVRQVVLISREVCKTWKRTIDKLACTLKPEDLKEKNMVQYLLSKNYSFKSSLDIDKFLQHFQTTHPSNVNPFPGKYIDILIGLRNPDYPQFSNRFSLFLGKYGQHICTIDMHIMFGYENPTEIYQKIVEWLKCMPNVQNLFIYFYIPFSLEDDREQVQFVALLPFKLKCLRKLAIDTYCPPVTDKLIPNWCWIQLYNLKRLVYQHDELDLLRITILNKKDADILENVTSSLKTLVVKYFCKENDVNLSQVFSMLSERFGSELERLNLEFRVNDKPSEHLKIMQNSFTGRLVLPKVKIVEINILSVFCLDFLLGMQGNLEELIINCVGGRIGGCEFIDFSVIEKIDIEEIRRNQIVKFLGYQDNMLESNIWSMFPKLGKISLTASQDRRMKVFKRKDWKINQFA